MFYYLYTDEIQHKAFVYFLRQQAALRKKLVWILKIRFIDSLKKIKQAINKGLRKKESMLFIRRRAFFLYAHDDIKVDSSRELRRHK